MHRMAIPAWVVVFWFRPGFLLLAASLLLLFHYSAHLQKKYSNPKLQRRLGKFYLSD